MKLILLFLAVKLFSNDSVSFKLWICKRNNEIGRTHFRIGSAENYFGFTFPILYLEINADYFSSACMLITKALDKAGLFSSDER